MTHSIRRLAAITAAALTIGLAQPALADGDVACGAGPQERWEPVRAVQRKAWRLGWEVLEVQVQGDCYEVYARNEQGQAIEAFLHPETLETLVIYRRGREIFRKAGFTG